MKTDGYTGVVIPDDAKELAIYLWQRQIIDVDQIDWTAKVIKMFQTQQKEASQ